MPDTILRTLYIFVFNHYHSPEKYRAYFIKKFRFKKLHDLPKATRQYTVVYSPFRFHILGHYSKFAFRFF